MLKNGRGSLLFLGLIFSALTAPPSQESLFAQRLPKPAFFLSPLGLSAVEPKGPAAFEVVSMAASAPSECWCCRVRGCFGCAEEITA